MTLGPLTFLAPLALLGLIILPLVWWLLRITPPKPLQQIFPPLRILSEVVTEEETPNSTPLWLLLFRLALTALIAIALAQPLLSKPEGIEAKPLVLVIDDSWAAAPNWPKITKEAENRITDARRKNVDVMVLTTTSENKAEFIDPSDALRLIKTLTPNALNNSPQDISKTIKTADLSKSNVIWLSAGTGQSPEAEQTLADQLSKGSQGLLLSPPSNVLPLIPGILSETVNGFRTVWHRPDGNGLRATDITAHSKDGRILARASITFTPGNNQSDTLIELPSELRSQITALRAADSPSAGSVKLLDDSWGRPLIGVLTEGRDSGSPLLSEPFYAETALKPYADVYRGTLEEILPLAPSIIVMPDAARDDSPELKTFIENGGLLIRFAGPKLAKRSDEYLPVRLREGGRALGGALTWEEPQNLSPFTPESPFFGLSIPDDIKVKRQVMAQPGAETDSRTWARLLDGSPVVTTKEDGFGRIVLFHVTAGPEWSNLPVSGLYVEMLRRLLTLAKTSPAKANVTSGDWAPERILNGYGRLISPTIFAKPIANDGFGDTIISSSNPPGLYRQGPRRKALNMDINPENYKSIKDLKGMTSASYGETRNNNLGGLLLSIALLMLALDAIFAILSSGRMSSLMRRFKPGAKATTAASLLLASSLILSPMADAQDTEQFSDALGLHLAYVETGDARTDRMSEAAMNGLVTALTNRTTIEPMGVRAIDPESDPLVLYSFLYWPIERAAAPLSDKAVTSLNNFMSSGGTIIFDTQDSGDQDLLAGNPHPGLKRVTEQLDIPSLQEVPEDHVLNKTFYLIDLYPGRWANGRVWVDQNHNGVARDGVSSVIIGSNDWAAAWAQTDDGEPLAELERDIPKQREMAIRFGVNMVMYTLAGNYKADQVHSAALVERLGQKRKEPQDLGADTKTDETQEEE